MKRRWTFVFLLACMLLISRTWGSSSPPAEPDFSSDDQDKKDGGTDASEVGAEGKKDGGADEPEQTMSEKDEAMGMAFASIARFADEAPEVYKMLRQALLARRALVLLDGLDEAGTERPAIERHVVQVLAPQGHAMLVTSRPSGVNEASFSAFHHLSLAPLTSEQQEEAAVPEGPLGPGVVNLDFGDESALRAALTEAAVAADDPTDPDLARAKLCSRLLVAVERRAFAALQAPRLEGFGALPLRPPLSEVLVPLSVELRATTYPPLRL